MEDNNKIMEEILRLQIQTLEYKLLVAKSGRKEELENKIAELKKNIKPVESIVKGVEQPKPKRQVIKPRPKKIVKPVVEEIPKPIVEAAVEELVKVIDEEILEHVKSLPTADEVEKEIEEEPVDYKFDVLANDEDVFFTTRSDEQTKIDALPVEEFNQDAEDLDALKEAIIGGDKPSNEVEVAEVIPEPVVEEVPVEAPVVVETTTTTKKKRKYTKRKKAPRNVPAKK